MSEPRCSVNLAMPVSSRHESVPRLVRDRPELVPELLAMLHVEMPPFTRVRISDVALHEAAPLSCLTMLELPVTDDQRSHLITLDYWLENAAYVESVGELLDSD